MGARVDVMKITREFKDNHTNLSPDSDNCDPLVWDIGWGIGNRSGDPAGIVVFASGQVNVPKQFGDYPVYLKVRSKPSRY